jgi:hypothetical protein
VYQPKDKIKPFLLILTGMLFSLGAHAAEETRWYDVEVILFAQTSQDYRDSEHWPVDYTLPKLEGSRELLSSTTASRNGEPVAFRRLTSAELGMRADADRVKRASDLELLAHFGWRQPGLAEDQAIPVHISNKLLEPSFAEKTDGMQRLDGTLTLILSRYLHMKADLLFREPLEDSAAGYLSGTDNAATDPTATQVEGNTDNFAFANEPTQELPHYRVYRLQDSVRMRSDETHYMDHPVFGVVVQVRPYELPQKDDAQ